ncbi:rho: transcription termination factor Rho [Rubrobacter radiotolerans]|uniref:Transcription termination factor Rho n=1 Tax=Rubrobacter radiotolerans TaxID=42256 RepID=A0A023X4E4_RUBRA|nr:transcription termination factor Rho [Rubrobacter radiotolerans]AHY46880.1 rho: transcription termination factor Rho [Rubrobacter radiotolerans]MDX5894285.1 transcription termination factor Rho [Rubrobacter radiotolerans]SMC05647.1 transcription termination factor Rho [Rubrobacter radiotolerans DSM 5868]
MTELATLERKRLSDLHQIASQLGIEKYRKYRKPELAELIFKVATEQAAQQAPAATSENGAGNGHTATVEPVEEVPRTEEQPAEKPRPEPQQKQQKQRENRQDGRADGRAERKGKQREGGESSGDAQAQSGILDVLPDGFGFLRTKGYTQSKGDVYVSTSQIKRFNLRRGDYVEGQIRPARDGEKYPAMVRIETVNGKEPQKGRRRVDFDDLTPLFPQERLRLEWMPKDIAPRVIDLVAPIGKGQRGLIVSPPKAGKTTILKQIAQSISANYPEVKLFVLLADERPEEVTDWERSVEGATVVASTFDQPADNHIAVAELLLERMRRLVEEGEDVVVILDSITRLARAYNLAAPASGRILSGGVDSAALYPPKKFFGAARNIEFGGSLTILASALVETGSRMDEVIYEEFKGTGNMEIHLERKLANRRIYPAINIEESSTRREELLMEASEAQRVWQVRSILNALDTSQKIELLIQKLKETKTNAEFLRELQRVRS